MTYESYPWQVLKRHFSVSLRNTSLVSLKLQRFFGPPFFIVDMVQYATEIYPGAHDWRYNSSCFLAFCYILAVSSRAEPDTHTHSFTLIHRK